MMPSDERGLVRHFSKQHIGGSGCWLGFGSRPWTSIYKDWDRFMANPKVLPTLKDEAQKPTRGRKLKEIPTPPMVFSDDDDEVQVEVKPTEDETASGASQPRTMLRKRKVGETASPDINAPEKKKTKL